MQEALANIMKHSGATEAVVSVACDDGSLKLSVEDNGSGFEQDSAPGGHGLKNMRERAALLGGRAAIESQPGAGSRVSVEIPLAGVVA